MFMPIVFFCLVNGAGCAFYAAPAVSSPQFCQQIAELQKQETFKEKERFDFFAVSCVHVKVAKEV